MKTYFDRFLFGRFLVTTITVYFIMIWILDAAPYEYDLVKTRLNSYVNAVDFLDKNEADARNSLIQNADEAVPALMRLFSENSDERYRGAILDIFANATKSQAQISAFLANQLKAPPNEWQGKRWIRSTINLLVKLDRTSARMIAIKALDSPDLEIQVTGIQALGKCGIPDDIARLKLYARNRILTNATHREDELTTEVNEATLRIGK